MVTQLAKKTYTVEEYLELELALETRSEYRNGEIIPLTGGTPNHNEIAVNLLAFLKPDLLSSFFCQSKALDSCSQDAYP
jgi:Uma2 family endonuclease